MEYYRSYMDRQEISPAVHEKLLKLEAPKQANRPWVRYGALAACAALILGVGAWKLAPQSHTAPVQEQTVIDNLSADEAPPLQPDVSQLGDWETRFVVHNHTCGEMISSMMSAIAYPDRTERSDIALSRPYAPGSFTVDLTKEDIQKLFWGPEGAPAGGDDLPWTLSWSGYTVYGFAWYDGEGQLTELTVYGEMGRASFELELRLGALPFTCVVDLNRGDEISEFNGVSVAGWSKVYDRDGDGVTDYICGSEFMTENDIGVRFTSQNNGRAENGVDGEARFNTLFVCQALISDGGLHLDHLMTADHIPAWRDVSFDTLEQARQEADFAPYLPQSSPMPDAWEFYGRLSYQEGSQDMLFVRWSKEYDNVEVDVYRGYRSYALADPDNPASYDLRLYDIPWSETVPEEYWDTVNCPTFKAEDMSLSIVEARGHEKDTGGLNFCFEVLHPDGTLVRYHCDGLTARQMWAMVEETL